MWNHRDHSDSSVSRLVWQLSDVTKPKQNKPMKTFQSYDCVNVLPLYLCLCDHDYVMLCCPLTHIHLNWVTRIVYIYFLSRTAAVLTKHEQSEVVREIDWGTDRWKSGWWGQIHFSATGRSWSIEPSTWSPAFLCLLLWFWLDHGGRRWSSNELLHHGWRDAQEEAEGETEEAPGHRWKPATRTIPPLPHAEEPLPQGLHQHRRVEVSFNETEYVFLITCFLR